MARRRILRSRQERRAEETSTPQKNVDILGEMGRSADGLA
jgi:hypothetical protein